MSNELNQEDHGGSYLTASMTQRKWSYKSWQERRDMVGKVWDRKSERRRKELLAALVAHSNEVANELSDEQ